MRRTLFSLVVWGMILGGASAALARSITLGYVEFPPMTYTDDQGRPAGKIIEIAARTIESAGYSWTAKSLPPKRLATMLSQGHVQLWVGLSTLQGFEGKVHIGEVVVEKLVLRAYTMGRMKPILRKEDLIGQTLLILRGYSYGGWINFIKGASDKIEVIEFDSHDIAFKRLAIFSEKKKDCYLLDYKHPSEMVLKKRGLPGIQFNDISSFNIHFVVTRQMEGAKEVLNRLESAFLQLQE